MTGRDNIENDAIEEPAEKPSVEFRLTFADGTHGQLGLHYETDEALLLGFDKLMGKQSGFLLSILMPIIPVHLHHLIPDSAPTMEEAIHG